MKTVHQIVKDTGGSYYQALIAIKALGVRGRLVNGERVWTDDEARLIVNMAAPDRGQEQEDER